ncbi:MAG: hypothetical protein WAU78_10490 [Roseiarcus sp.]
MGYTPIRIANMALASFGAAPIQTFENGAADATPAGSTVALLYPLVIRGLFAEYPWNFAKVTVPLDQLAETPLSDGLLPSGWQLAFALPDDFIGLPERILANNRYPDGPETRFEIQGATVYTNQLALWAIGTVYVDEADWPDYFSAAAVACFAAEIYSPITGNGPRLADLRADAWGSPQENRLGGKLGNARRIDSRANPSRVITHNPLIDVRTATIEVIPTGATYP